MFSIIDLKNIDQFYSSSATERYKKIIDKFTQSYGHEPEFIARAPGRVNIIGEHIDYEGYGVLPSAIEKDCLIAVKTTGQQNIHLRHISSIYPPCTITNDPEQKIEFIDNYVKYFFAGYRAGTKSADHKTLVGLQLVIQGNVPVASGLSSSSALCVCSALASLHANSQNGKVPKVEVIERCIKSEREVGTASGGMDQSISIMGKLDFCLYIQFDPIRCSEVHLPEGYRFIIMNSLVESAKLETAVYRYNKRVCECRIAVALLSKKMGVPEEIRKNWKILKELQNWSKLPLNSMASIVQTFLEQKRLHSINDSRRIG